MLCYNEAEAGGKEAAAMNRARIMRALAILLAASLAAMGLAALCHARHACDDPACCPVCQGLRARRMMAGVEGAAALLLTVQMASRRRGMGERAPRAAETPVTLRVQMRD